MSSKLCDALKKFRLAKELKDYLKNKKQFAQKRYFLNPMKPGIRLTKQQRKFIINRYKLKRNKRRWGQVQNTDQEKTSVNRRLRIQGRFISKLKACKLLFGCENVHHNYTFEQLNRMLSDKFQKSSNTKAEKPSDA